MEALIVLCAVVAWLSIGAAIYAGVNAALTDEERHKLVRENGEEPAFVAGMVTSAILWPAILVAEVVSWFRPDHDSADDDSAK